MQKEFQNASNLL